MLIEKVVIIATKSSQLKTKNFIEILSLLYGISYLENLLDDLYEALKNQTNLTIHS